jgi:hypothetical protein
MENKYLEKGKDFEIYLRRIEFRIEGIVKFNSLFSNILIKKMIIEWYFILFCCISFILLVKSRSTIMNYFGCVCLSIFFLYILVNKYKINIHYRKF